jgi:fatty-acyl-CoA synthase
MALLKIDGRFDLDTLARRLETLPRYARPLFLRLAHEIETTETFKPKRHVYVELAFDPARIDDLLYVFDREREIYVTLDAERHAAIQTGTVRF